MAWSQWLNTAATGALALPFAWFSVFNLLRSTSGAKTNYVCKNTDDVYGSLPLWCD